MELDSKHDDTLRQLFAHPTSHNIEWHDVLSLLKAVGTVEERHDGKVHVAIGDDSLTLHRPNVKDIDTQEVIDLRRVLTNAGYAPGGDATA
jgi:hypothetical protein